MSEDEVQMINASVSDVDSRVAERKVSELMYPHLKKHIVEKMPAYMELFNSEFYSWLPQSFLPHVKAGAAELRPDFFIAPHFFARYRSPHANAATTVDGVNIQYGELENIGVFPYIVILDAKKGTDSMADSVIGDFFNYFEHSTQHFDCTSRGMLFNQKEFILVEFNTGSLTKFLRADWKIAGTRRLIQEFLIPKVALLPNIITEACASYGASPAIFSSASEGTAFLGQGAAGTVIRIVKESDKTEYAMKVILDYTRDVGFIKTQELLTRDPLAKYILRVLPDSFKSFRHSDFSSFLMPVAEPLPNPGKNRTIIEMALQSLGSIHALGFVHGDARIQNCVYHEKQAKWIDLDRATTFSTNGILDDFKNFLETIGKSFSQKKGLIEKYAAKIVSKEWDATHVISRNIALQQILE